MSYDLSLAMSRIIIELVPLKNRSRVFDLIGSCFLDLLQPQFVVIFPSSYGFRQRFLHYSPIFLGDVPHQLISHEYEKHLEALLKTLPNTPLLHQQSFSHHLSNFLSNFSLTDTRLCVQIRTASTFHGIIFIGPPKFCFDFTDEDLNFLHLLCSELVLVFERILSLEELEEANRQLEIFNTQLQKRINMQAIELNQAKLLHRKEADFKTNFLAKVTHDIRTPLQVIRGLSQALQEGEVTADDTPNAIELLTLSVSRLRLLLDDILELDIPTPTAPLCEHQKVNLVEFFSEVDQFFLQLLKNSSVEYRSIHHDLLDGNYYFDGLKVNQLIINLLTNSLKYTSNGIIEFHTWITYKNSSESVLELCIRDTGLGISETLLSNLFEPLIDRTEVSGWGLGLSICLDIISLLDGQIWVDPTADIGTSVHLRIPILRTFKTGYCKKNALDTIYSGQDYRHLSVLVCDDDALNRHYADLLLRNIFQLTVVASGEAAMEMILDKRFDLILMDIRMPGINGIDAMTYIKNNLDWHPCPIVALTAQAMSEDRDFFLQKGFDDYIAKPATLHDILNCVSRLIGDKHDN